MSVDNSTELMLHISIGAMIAGVLAVFIWGVLTNEFDNVTNEDRVKLFWPWFGLSMFCFGGVYLLVTYVVIPVIHSVADAVLTIISMWG